MCLKFQSNLTEDNKVIAPFELLFFVLDDTEHLTYQPLQLDARMSSFLGNTRARPLSKHDVYGDG